MDIICQMYHYCCCCCCCWISIFWQLVALTSDQRARFISSYCNVCHKHTQPRHRIKQSFLAEYVYLSFFGYLLSECQKPVLEVWVAGVRTPATQTSRRQQQERESPQKRSYIKYREQHSQLQYQFQRESTSRKSEGKQTSNRTASVANRKYLQDVLASEKDFKTYRPYIH